MEDNFGHQVKLRVPDSFPSSNLLLEPFNKCVIPRVGPSRPSQIGASARPRSGCPQGVAWKMLQFDWCCIEGRVRSLRGIVQSIGGQRVHIRLSDAPCRRRGLRVGSTRNFAGFKAVISNTLFGYLCHNNTPACVIAVKICVTACP